MDIDKAILLSALENAQKFKGHANPGAIIGKLLSEDPKLRDRLDELNRKANKAVLEVNKLTFEAQRERLLELNPEFDMSEKERKIHNKESRLDLPSLENAIEGKVVTRMPPGPSKYPHAGHAISFVINYLYAKKYGGRCILRFDDTNPEVESEEYVDAIMEDIVDYLGLKPDTIVFASDSMDKFYGFARELITKGMAYACSCQSEEMSDGRRNMKPCVHRDSGVPENIAIWEGMLQGNNEGYALRLKIDMSHKNAVMRDPVIFRVITAEHYRQKGKYKAWPTYDFESAVMDGLLGITHVLRSNEFDSRIELHNHIAKSLGITSPFYRHYGRSTVSGAITKGREIRKLIESGEFLGWDDPRLVTLRALRRRGIVKEALYYLARSAGLSKQATNIDFTVIASENKRILDETAKRMFFISYPVKVTVKDAPKRDITIPLHPDKDMGERKFHTDENYILDKIDHDRIKEGETVRLIDNINITRKEGGFVLDSLDFKSFKGKGRSIIHFLPDNENDTLKAEILMPDLRRIEGLAESSVRTLSVGDVVQFQRFGFCRLDSISEGIYCFWFSHQ